jgi:hypothetical protein
MSDQTLLSFGAAATFIAAAGIYVYLRAVFNEHSVESRVKVPVRVESGREAEARRSPRGRAA